MFLALGQGGTVLGTSSTAEADRSNLFQTTRVLQLRAATHSVAGARGLEGMCGQCLGPVRPKALLSVGAFPRPPPRTSPALGRASQAPGCGGQKHPLSQAQPSRGNSHPSPPPPSCRASSYPIPNGPRPPSTTRLSQALSCPLPWPLLWSLTPEMGGVQVGARVFPACCTGHTCTTSPWAPTEPRHWSLHPVG